MKAQPSSLFLVSYVFATILAMPALADNTLSVVPRMTMEGTQVLKISLEGSTNHAYVQSNEPNNTPTFTQDWLMKKKTLDMDAQKKVCFAMTKRKAPARPVYRAFIRKNLLGKLKMIVVVEQESGPPVRINAFRVPGGTFRVTLEYASATNADSNDGVLRVYKNGVLESERTNLDNPDPVGRARIGHCGGTGTGFYFLDDYRSEL